MAEILPFHGQRYDENLAGALGRNIAPPYDVIDAALREKLYAASPCNICRITFPRPPAAPEPRPYEGVAHTFADWMSEGIVKRDADPAIYVYQQQFELEGATRSRTGMIVLLRLEEFGSGMHAHETTHAAPKVDRLNLLRATNTNFGLVFGLYRDGGNTVTALLDEAKIDPALAEATDLDGMVHTVWAIRDVASIGAIRAAMRGHDVFIADGHHRYETALNYMRERPDSVAARYRMMILVDVADPGLVVLPTHRMVKNVRDFTAEKLLTALRADFEVRPLPAGADARPVFAALDEARRRGRQAFGVCLAGNQRAVLTLTNPRAMAGVGGHSEAWKRLDVSILQGLVLERALGIPDEDRAKEHHIEYVKHSDAAVSAALRRLTPGDGQALFLMNATPVSAVEATAAAGERMPQKSTFFYPKVFTGVVMRTLDEDEAFD